jgi:hypothetical protein
MSSFQNSRNELSPHSLRGLLNGFLERRNEKILSLFYRIEKHYFLQKNANFRKNMMHKLIEYNIYIYKRKTPYGERRHHEKVHRRLF